MSLRDKLTRETREGTYWCPLPSSKNVFPWRSKYRIIPNIWQILGIIRYLHRQGKNIFELGRGHLELPSHVSRVELSLKLTKLCVYDVLLSS